MGRCPLPVAALALLVQLYVSIRDRAENRVPAGDPWDGRALEWACPAPAPEYNFAVLPAVLDRDAFTAAKEFGTAYRAPDKYVDITLPRNAAVGPVLGGLGFVLAFGLVWHIWWLVILATLAVFATMIARGFARRTTRVIPAAEVRAGHERWLALVRAAAPATRAVENSPANQGLAASPSAEAAA